MPPGKRSGRVSKPLYWVAQRLTPIACVDALVRSEVDGTVRWGLIERRSEDGDRVWALVGGGVHRGETLDEALGRHLRETLGEGVTWSGPDTTSPHLVAQYFPQHKPGHGRDRRKHAIALTYLVDLTGIPTPQGEALRFEWFTADTLPGAEEVWPGQHAVLLKMVDSST